MHVSSIIIQFTLNVNVTVGCFSIHNSADNIMECKDIYNTGSEMTLRYVFRTT